MGKPSLLILPGDGIGPEVMVEVRKVIEWFTINRGLEFDVSEDLVGGAAYDAHGTPLHDDTMKKALDVDAVLLGAVGGPKYDNLDFSLKKILSNEVKKIIRNTGTTTIMVTHDEIEAERLSDECYLLENGKIKQI